MMTVTDYKVEREFLNHEIAIWGIEEVEDMLNRGYRVVSTPNGVTWASAEDGESEKADLTSGNNYASMIPARHSFLPFRVMLTSNRVSAVT